MPKYENLKWHKSVHRFKDLFLVGDVALRYSRIYSQQ